MTNFFSDFSRKKDLKHDFFFFFFFKNCRKRNDNSKSGGRWKGN